MNIRTFCWATAAVVLTVSPAAAQFVSSLGVSPSDTAIINVVGRGEILVPPTRAIVFIQIVSEDVSATAAAQANASVRSRVQEALVLRGFGEDRVTLWGFGAGQANPRMRVTTPSQSAPPQTFEAKAGLRVVVEPLDRLEEVVSAALEAGAEGVPLVQFETPNAIAAEREAAKMAVAAARASASAIAEAAGGELGDLRQITVLPDFNSSMVVASRLVTGGVTGQGVQLVPSDVSVKVQVQASWVFILR